MSTDTVAARPAADPPGRRVGLVDWHSHMQSDRLVPSPAATGDWPGLRRGGNGWELTLGGGFYRHVDERTFAVDARLAEMDAQGVVVQVLSAPPYAVAFHGPPAEAASLAAQQNEFLAGVVAQVPERFAMVAMLPLSDAAAVAAELARVAAYPGVVGASVTAHRDDHLCAPEHVALWRELAESGLLVFVHPADTHLPECDVATGSVFGAAMPLATARTATRMLTSGLLAAVPELRVLLAHAGGALPSVIDRLTHAWRLGQLPGLAESPLASVRRSFWADAIAYAAAPLRLAAETFGVDRVVYGSDSPFPAAQTPAQLDALDPPAGLLAQATANGSRLLALSGRHGLGSGGASRHSAAGTRTARSSSRVAASTAGDVST